MILTRNRRYGGDASMGQTCSKQNINKNESRQVGSPSRPLRSHHRFELSGENKSVLRPEARDLDPYSSAGEEGMHEEDVGTEEGEQMD